MMAVPHSDEMLHGRLRRAQVARMLEKITVVLGGARLVLAEVLTPAADEVRLDHSFRVSGVSVQRPGACARRSRDCSTSCMAARNCSWFSEVTV